MHMACNVNAYSEKYINKEFAIHHFGLEQMLTIVHHTRGVLTLHGSRPGGIACLSIK